MSKCTSICFCQSHHPPMPCYLKDLFFNLDNLTSTPLWAIYLPLWFCLLRGLCTPIMFPLFNWVCAHRYFNAHFWVLGRGYLHKPDWKVSFQSRIFWIEHCMFAYEALFTFLFALNEYIRFFHVETVRYPSECLRYAQLPLFYNVTSKGLKDGKQNGYLCFT